MAKYNAEFKINIVQKYLNGEGRYTYPAKKYGINNKSQIHRWVCSYKKFVEEGLFRTRRNKNILFNSS